MPGACAAGAVTCQGGSLVCMPLLMAMPETCNGVDDNCNGVYVSLCLCLSFYLIAVCNAESTKATQMAAFFALPVNRLNVYLCSAYVCLTMRAQNRFARSV